MHFETAKEALDVLDKSYKVSDKAKRVKLQTLCIEFGLMWIKNNETIDEYSREHINWLIRWKPMEKKW